MRRSIIDVRLSCLGLFVGRKARFRAYVGVLLRIWVCDGSGTFWKRGYWGKGWLGDGTDWSEYCRMCCALLCMSEVALPPGTWYIPVGSAVLLFPN